MKVQAIFALAIVGLVAACHSESSIQHLNQEQTAELNAIAANTSDTAGNEAAQNGANMGDVYRSGATAPAVHH